MSLFARRTAFCCAIVVNIQFHAHLEGDCLVLAGMGGTLIRKILQDPERDRCSQIITQANSDQPLIRAFLSRNGWRIQAETIVQIQHKYYVTIAWNKGEESLTPKEIQLGKELLQERPLLWQNWLRQEQLRLQKIEEQRGRLSSLQFQYLSWNNRGVHEGCFK